jgi:hypothetical protein
VVVVVVQAARALGDPEPIRSTASATTPTAATHTPISAARFGRRGGMDGTDAAAPGAASSDAAAKTAASIASSSEGVHQPRDSSSGLARLRLDMASTYVFLTEPP